MRTCIMHIDFDAFFASVEQIRTPRLAGRPVIVGNGVIASCSYEARKFGLLAGMSLRQARKLCPQAIILDGHYQVYRAFAEQVFDICREITCNLETYLDEAYGDLTGTERYYQGYLNAGRQLRERITKATRLPVTIGLGPNRMVAKMAGKSVKPRGLRLIPEPEIDEFIKEQPIGHLPGVGRTIEKTLTILGVRMIGELRAFSADDLRTLFGAPGAVLYDRCRGKDTAVLNPREIPTTISRETAFHNATIEMDTIKGMLYYLIERAMRTTRSLGLKAKTALVKIRYSDSSNESKQRSLPQPTALDKEVYDLALRLLEQLYTRRAALRHIGVVLSNFSYGGDDHRQGLLFDDRNELKFSRLYNAIDTVRARYGHSALVVGRSLDLLGKLRQDSYGYVLRTPSLTK